MHSGTDDPEGPGFPIRKSQDQSLFASSPGLIAGYHVLHRLSTPSHPPRALSSLITPTSNRHDTHPSPPWRKGACTEPDGPDRPGVDDIPRRPAGIEQPAGKLLRTRENSSLGDALFFRRKKNKNPTIHLSKTTRHPAGWPETAPLAADRVAPHERDTAIRGGAEIIAFHRGLSSIPSTDPGGPVGAAGVHHRDGSGCCFTRPLLVRPSGRPSGPLITRSLKRDTILYQRLDACQLPHPRAWSRCGDSVENCFRDAPTPPRQPLSQPPIPRRAGPTSYAAPGCQTPEMTGPDRRPPGYSAKHPSHHSPAAGLHRRDRPKPPPSRPSLPDLRPQCRPGPTNH